MPKVGDPISCGDVKFHNGTLKNSDLLYNKRINNIQEKTKIETYDLSKDEKIIKIEDCKKSNKNKNLIDK